MSLNQSESQEVAIFHHNMKAYFKTNDETLVTRNKQSSLHDIRSKTNVTEFYSIERITLIYGGPWVSRHNQISHGTTKYLTAQPNISRHNQKLSRHNQISHGKTKYLTAQPNISRHNQITNRKTKNFHGKIK